MISVIIPLYNQAKKLPPTLISLDKQADVDYEVMVVNDGSTDGAEAAFSAAYRRLKTERHYLFINQAHAGAPAARNRGAREAQGEYLFFCDADAVLKPEALSVLLQALNDNPEASYAYSSFYWGRKLFKPGRFDPDKLRSGPCIHTMALLRRSAFPADGWDESIKKFQDWDLWLTILEQGGIGVFVPRALFTVSPGGSMSAWLPSFAYKLLPFLPAVKRYKAALKIIKQKHELV